MTYLGRTFLWIAEIKTEIQKRIISRNRCTHACSRLLKTKIISQSAKIRLGKTLIRPTITYESEVWALGKTNEKMLKV